MTKKFNCSSLYLHDSESYFLTLFYYFFVYSYYKAWGTRNLITYK